MGKVLLAHLPPAALDEFFAAGPLRRLTSRTIVEEGALRRALDEVRTRGWAFADQESEDGVRTVAVPLYARNLRVEAAMNVSGHASRVPMKELRSRYLPVLMDAAAEISRALGADVSPPKSGSRRRRLDTNPEQRQTRCRRSNICSDIEHRARLRRGLGASETQRMEGAEKHQGVLCAGARCGVFVSAGWHFATGGVVWIVVIALPRACPSPSQSRCWAYRPGRRTMGRRRGARRRRRASRRGSRCRSRLRRGRCPRSSSDRAVRAR
jgi:hypothetical protein